MWGVTNNRLGKGFINIRVKWVSSVCCDWVLLSLRVGFGRAGKHSRLLYSLSLSVQH